MEQLTVAPAPAPPLRGPRRVGFYVAVGLTLAALGVFPPLLAGPVIAWLDGDAMDGLFGEENLAAHRVHIEGATLVFWVVVVGMIAQLRRPETKSAPLVAAAATWLFFLVLELTHLVDPFSIALAVLLILAVVLHPQVRPARRLELHSRPLALTALAGAPALFYAVQQLRLQLTGSASDPHVAQSHYALMAALVFGLAVSALLGATNWDGHQICAWAAAAITVVLGVYFVAHTGYASSVPAFWGAAMVAWAPAYLLAASRTRVVAPTGEADGAL